MTRLFCIDTAGGWRLVFVCFSLLLCSMSSAIVLHPDGEPNLTVWTDHPVNNVIGRWGTNASCVAIGKRYVISTRHQDSYNSGVGKTIAINGINYTVGEELNIHEDLRIARITGPQGRVASLPDYANIYPNISKSWQLSNINNKYITMAGFGKIRGTSLIQDGTVYGYSWATNTGNLLHWATNKIDIYIPSGSVNELLLQADFDSLGITGSTIYETAPAEYDSGGGWFIDDGGAWKLAGVTAGVDPCTVKQQSWFLNPADISNPNPAVGKRFFAHWLNDYVATIQNAIIEPAIPTGISAAVGYNCGEILLSWDSVSGVDGYRVYYSQGSAEFVLHSSVLSTQTSRTIGSLNPNTTYNFAVTAYKGIAESDYSSIAVAAASTNCQYQISGYVMDSGNPIQGVVIDANNGATTDIIDSQGYYSISVPYGWSGSITPSKFGYSFTPQSLMRLNVTANITVPNFEANAPILIDDFNDNARSADWIVQNPDFPTTIIDETNQRLEISSSNDINPTEAFCSANGWKISSEQNFSLKIEFHNEILTQSFAGVAIRLVDSNARENYIRLSVASEANQPIFAVQAGMNGMLIDCSVPRTSSDGSLWISYNSDTNEIYLSLNGFGPEDYFQVVSLPEKIDWIIELVGFTENFGFASGLAWFDNFTIQTGKLTNWPPKTDINQDGFVDIEDLCEMAGQWLNTGGGFSADIDSDGYVDFVDLARLAEVW